MLRLEGEAPSGAQAGPGGTLDARSRAGAPVPVREAGTEVLELEWTVRHGQALKPVGGESVSGNSADWWNCSPSAAEPCYWIDRLTDVLTAAPHGTASERTSRDGPALMSDDTDPKQSAKVARLHPPGLPHQASLDRGVQAQIGAQLRTMYEHYVEQPIPDRLIELVRRLGEFPSSDGKNPGVDESNAEASR